MYFRYNLTVPMDLLQPLLQIVGKATNSNRKLLLRNQKMKQTDRLKKQKSPTVKAVILANAKKTEPKKTLKKEDVPIPKTLSFATGHTKLVTGVTTGTQSSKQFNPMAASLKASPKASLAEIKAVPKETKKRVEMAQRSKEEIKKSLANVIKVYYPEKKTCLDNSMTEITKDTSSKDQKLARSDFHFQEVIGEGGYGKVWRVEMVRNKKHYAMKEMSKALVVMKKSVENVLNERKILENLSSPFIANMVFAFNDRDNLYLVMDLLSGGDLRYRIGCTHRFTEQQSRFLVGCILTAVDFIHRKKIFHRDIKPENLVFDELGYLRLTDFGIARAQNSKQALDASGTPGYMAPQVLCKQMHSYEVDYYAVGIIAHELMMGKRPYSGNNRMEIRDAVLSKQHLIKKSEVPQGWSVEAADFVNKLIVRTPANRLGSKQGVKEIKAHPWFHHYDWASLESKSIKSPFREKDHVMEVPERVDEYNEALMQYKLLQRADSKVDAFAKYYFQLAEK